MRWRVLLLALLALGAIATAIAVAKPLKDDDGETARLAKRLKQADDLWKTQLTNGLDTLRTPQPPAAKDTEKAELEGVSIQRVKNKAMENMMYNARHGAPPPVEQAQDVSHTPEAPEKGTTFHANKAEAKGSLGGPRGKDFSVDIDREDGHVVARGSRVPETKKKKEEEDGGKKEEKNEDDSEKKEEKNEDNDDENEDNDDENEDDSDDNDGDENTSKENNDSGENKDDGDENADNDADDSDEDKGAAERFAEWGKKRRRTKKNKKRRRPRKSSSFSPSPGATPRRTSSLPFWSKLKRPQQQQQQQPQRRSSGRRKSGKKGRRIGKKRQRKPKPFVVEDEETPPPKVAPSAAGKRKSAGRASRRKRKLIDEEKKFEREEREAIEKKKKEARRKERDAREKEAIEKSKMEEIANAKAAKKAKRRARREARRRAAKQRAEEKAAKEAEEKAAKEAEEKAAKEAEEKAAKEAEEKAAKEAEEKAAKEAEEKAAKEAEEKAAKEAEEKAAKEAEEKAAAEKAAAEKAAAEKAAAEKAAAEKAAAEKAAAEAKQAAEAKKWEEEEKARKEAEKKEKARKEAERREQARRERRRRRRMLRKKKKKRLTGIRTPPDDTPPKALERACLSHEKEWLAALSNSARQATPEDALYQPPFDPLGPGCPTSQLRDVSAGQDMSPACLKNLHKLVSRAGSVLDGASLRWWITGGTLLSSLRLGRIASWDVNAQIDVLVAPAEHARTWDLVGRVVAEANMAEESPGLVWDAANHTLSFDTNHANPCCRSMPSHEPLRVELRTAWMGDVELDREQQRTYAWAEGDPKAPGLDAAEAKLRRRAARRCYDNSVLFPLKRCPLGAHCFPCPARSVFWAARMTNLSTRWGKWRYDPSFGPCGTPAPAGVCRRTPEQVEEDLAAVRNYTAAIRASKWRTACDAAP